MIELKRNPEGTIEKRSRPTVKPQLPKYGGSGGKSSQQNRENSLHHKSKTRNMKLRKELRHLDDQIQVKREGERGKKRNERGVELLYSDGPSNGNPLAHTESSFSSSFFMDVNKSFRDEGERDVDAQSYLFFSLLFLYPLYRSCWSSWAKITTR